MPVVPAAALRQLSCDLLMATGTPAAAAAVVADSLIDANLTGHDSHGVLRLPAYLEGVRLGHVMPGQEPRLIAQRGAAAIVDAGDGWGQPAMQLATETAIDLANACALGAATVRRSYHIGRVAPYVEAIARRGKIGLAMANCAPAVAPFGGSARVMGTNPIAWAVPRGEGKPPICLDVATAAIAEGKLRYARSRAATIPAGCLVDRDGQPTVDPNDFYAGGALLPFGGHKGSGFSLLAQFIGRGLAGMDPSAYDGPRGVNGPFVLAIDIAAFAEPAEFAAQIEAQCAAVVGCRPEIDGAAVLLPGDRELAERERRSRDGVPVPESTWDELRAAARDHGVAAPDVAATAAI